MGGQGLQVDCATMRRAATIVEEAASAFGRAPTAASAHPGGGSLGSSSHAQAAVAATARSLQRAQDAAHGLAGRSRTMSGAMQTTATTFELAESVIGAFR